MPLNNYIVALVIITLLFGAYLGYSFKGCISKPQTITQVETDTLYIKQKPDTILTTAYLDKIKLDTVFIDANLDTINSIQVASLDTTFTNKDSISISYFYWPVNKFSLKYYPQPEREIIKTVYISYSPKFYNQPTFRTILGYSLGVITTITLYNVMEKNK